MKNYNKVIDLDDYLQYLGRDFNGKICFFGCQGVASSWVKYFQGSKAITQHSIGTAIRTLNPDITFVLGDNFYENGLSGDPQEASKEFQLAFIEPYKGLRCFCVLGNHDYYIHPASPWGKHYLLARMIGPLRYWHSNPEKTMERGMRQVELSNHRLNPKLSSNGIYQWNMPYRYYLLHSKVADFFVLDSSNFLFDQDQQDWFLINLEARSKVKNKKILVMHHPIVSAGKRLSSMDDIRLYAAAFGCSHEQFNEIEKDMRTCQTGEIGRLIYHLLLKKLIDSNMPNYFDCLICAHDHMMTVDQLEYPFYAHTTQAKPRITQVISGGGGAALANSRENLHALTNLRKQGTIADQCKTSYSGLHYGFNQIDVNTMKLDVYNSLGIIQKSFFIA